MAAIRKRLAGDVSDSGGSITQIEGWKLAQVAGFPKVYNTVINIIPTASIPRNRNADTDRQNFIYRDDLPRKIGVRSC